MSRRSSNNPSESDWHERVVVIMKDLGLDVIDDHMDLFDEGVLDSLTFIELLARLEETIGMAIRFESLDLDRFRSVPAIAALMSTLDAQRLRKVEGAA
jgi:acyl carrier protein